MHGGDDEPEPAMEMEASSNAVVPYDQRSNELLVMGDPVTEYKGEEFATLYVKATRQQTSPPLYVDTTSRLVYSDTPQFDNGEPIAELSGNSHEGYLIHPEKDDDNITINGDPIPEAQEAAPRRLPHQIEVANKFKAQKQVATANDRANKWEEAANNQLTVNNQKVAATDKAQVGRIYAASLKKEAHGDTAAQKLPQLKAAAVQAEQEFLELSPGNEKGSEALSSEALIKATKQLMGGTGEIGETRRKVAYNFFVSCYALLKAEEQVKQGEQAAQLADLNAAVIAHQSKRRRGMAEMLLAPIQQSNLEGVANKKVMLQHAISGQLPLVPVEVVTKRVRGK